MIIDFSLTGASLNILFIFFPQRSLLNSQRIDKERADPMKRCVQAPPVWCDVHSLCVSCYFTCEQAAVAGAGAGGGGGELKEEVRKECAELGQRARLSVESRLAPASWRVNSDQK